MATITTVTVEERLEELKILLNSGGFDELFSKALQPPEVEDRVMIEIRSLSGTVQEIKEVFRKIAADLVGFDSAGFKDEHSKVLSLGPQWRGYCERFNVILEMSYMNAMEAVAFLKQYDVLLAHIGSESNFIEIKLELQQFVKKLEVKAGKALQAQNSFGELAEDVALFEAVIDDTMLKAGAYLTMRLMAAHEKLKALRTRLDELSQKMTKIGLACISSLTIGAATIALAVVAASPANLFSALEQLSTAIKHGVAIQETRYEKSKVKKEIKISTQEIVELSAQDLVLEKYKKTFDEAKQDIRNLAHKIDVIANIWRTLKSDMIDLQTELSLAVDPDMPITKLFPAKIAATRLLYDKLAKLLAEYAKGYNTA